MQPHAASSTSRRGMWRRNRTDADVLRFLSNPNRIRVQSRWTPLQEIRMTRETDDGASGSKGEGTKGVSSPRWSGLAHTHEARCASQRTHDACDGGSTRPRRWRRSSETSRRRANPTVEIRRTWAKLGVGRRVGEDASSSARTVERNHVRDSDRSAGTTWTSTSRTKSRARVRHLVPGRGPTIRALSLPSFPTSSLPLASAVPPRVRFLPSSSHLWMHSRRSNGRVRPSHCVSFGVHRPPSFVAMDVWITCHLRLCPCTDVDDEPTDPTTEDSDPHDPCLSHAHEKKKKNNGPCGPGRSLRPDAPFDVPVHVLFGLRFISPLFHPVFPPPLPHSNLSPRRISSSAPCVHFRSHFPSFPLPFGSDLSVPRGPSNPLPRPAGAGRVRDVRRTTSSRRRGGRRCAHVRVSRRHGSCEEGFGSGRIGWKRRGRTWEDGGGDASRKRVETRRSESVGRGERKTWCKDVAMAWERLGSSHGRGNEEDWEEGWDWMENISIEKRRERKDRRNKRDRRRRKKNHGWS